MISFIEKHITKIVVSIFCLLVGASILVIGFQSDSFHIEEKIVYSCVIEDNNIYFEFQNDATKYITYESYGVDTSNLKDLKNGDVVSIKLKIDNNSFIKSKYTIIYELKYNDNTLFDVTEYLWKNHISIIILFATIPFSASLSLIVLTLFYIKKPKKAEIVFDIKHLSNLFVPFYVVASIGFLIAIVFLILITCKLIPKGNTAFVTIPLFFLVAGLLGIIVCLRDRFYLINGKYKLVTIFKTYKFKNDELACVYERNNPIAKRYFVSNDDKIICKTSADNDCLKSYEFHSALDANNQYRKPVYIDFTLIKENFISEEDQIKALRLFDKKQYREALPMFESFFKKHDLNIFKYHIMICSIYCNDLNRSEEMCKLLEQPIKDDSNVFSELSLPIMKCHYAKALAETNHPAETKKQFEEIKKLLTSGNFSDKELPSKAMINELTWMTKDIK